MNGTAFLEQPMAWAQRAWERHGARLPGWSAALFTVLLAISLARLFWLLWPQGEPAVWRPMPVTQKAGASATRTDINALINAHLFGVYQVSPAIPTAREAPDTPLNLTLMGIFAGTTEDYSRALIAQQGGSELPYSKGDRITPGVILQKIMTDRVILLRDGKLETLRLEKEKPSTAQAPVSADTASAETSSALSLAQARDEMLRDPAKAGEYIRIQPAMQNGQQRGYRVYPGKERGVFNLTGLRPGDLVTSVNGVELNDPGRGLQLLGQLAQTPNLNVTLERGGQVQNLNLTLN